MLHYDYVTRHIAERAKMVREINRFDPGHKAGLYSIAEALRSSGDFQSGALSTAAMVMYARQGQQVFEIGPHLASMFEQTKISSVPRDQLRLPYDAFYVSLPNSDLQVWGGKRTQWHQLKGFYVVLSEDRVSSAHGATSSADTLTVVLWGGENSRSIMRGDDATMWGRLRLDEGVTTDDLSNLEDRLEAMLAPENGEHDPIIDMLSGDTGENLEDGEILAGRVRALSAVFRIAINLSLYLSTAGAETKRLPTEDVRGIKRKIRDSKSPGKRKRYERQLAGISAATVTVIGQSINDIEAAHARGEGSGTVSPHWVRGHWHKYKTGKGRQTTTLKWVKPYPKGLDDAVTTDAAAHTYKVKGK